MNAIEFVKNFGRMCAKNECYNCEVEHLDNCDCIRAMIKYPEKVLDIVYRWSKDNPLTTNKDKFEEVFGEDLSSIVFGRGIDTWLDEEYKDNGEDTNEEV